VSILKTEIENLVLKTGVFHLLMRVQQLHFPPYSDMTRLLAVGWSLMNQNRPLLTPWPDVTAARGKATEKLQPVSAYSLLK
jgi:hypothetical protein